MRNFDRLDTCYIVLMICRVIAVVFSIYLAAVCLSLSDNMPANVIYGGIVLVVSYISILIVPRAIIFVIIGNNSRFNDETFIFKAKIKENCISNTFKKVNYGINEQIYFINNVFLKYIAVHKIDNLNLRACKDARSKTNAYIREQYLDSNLLLKLFGNCCYEVNVFWYDGECDNIFDVAKKIISKLNPETRSDFKKINIIYLAKENKIVCKRYDGALKYYYISVKQFFYYRNCIRLFCRLYNIDIKMFTHLL